MAWSGPSPSEAVRRNATLACRPLLCRRRLTNDTFEQEGGFAVLVMNLLEKMTAAQSVHIHVFTQVVPAASHRQLLQPGASAFGRGRVRPRPDQQRREFARLGGLGPLLEPSLDRPGPSGVPIAGDDNNSR